MKRREKKPRKILEPERERQFVLAPKIHTFFSSPKECELGTRKGERHFFGSKGPHFLAPDINPGAKKRGGNRA